MTTNRKCDDESKMKNKVETERLQNVQLTWLLNGAHQPSERLGRRDASTVV